MHYTSSSDSRSGLKRPVFELALLCTCVLGLASSTLISHANEPREERSVESRVTSVALFKNGLAVVKQRIALDGAGRYRLNDVPKPIHGTFMVAGDGILETRVEMRDHESEASQLGSRLDYELAGLEVTILLRDSDTPIQGVVQRYLEREKLSDVTVSSPSRFLVLETRSGVAYVDQSQIVSLETSGVPQPTRPPNSSKPVLLMVAGEGATHVELTYLTHGISWAPSYLVDLQNDTLMTLEQTAVIRNELMDLEDTEILAISGYPSVQFGHVVSPLVSQQNWQQFFQQLGGGQSSNNRFSNAIVMQNSAYSSDDLFGGSEPIVAPNMGDTLDLHYQSLGKRTLRKGASLNLSVGRADADFERIVEWTIPDNRDAWGNPQNNARVDPRTGSLLQDDVWDALQFDNKLPFPMTSAPATVMADGRFGGQGEILWTNKDQEVTLRVNKALSLRAQHVESEKQSIQQQGDSVRDVINVGGRRFRKVIVEGELRLCNHRSTPASMHIKRRFSGDYLSGEGDPTIDLREEGVWTINRRNELRWLVDLEPAEERTIRYSYSVLVNF